MLFAGIILMFVLASGCAGDENCTGRDTMETMPEQRLSESLMCDYSRFQRPVKDHTMTVDVAVQLNLKYLKFDKLEEMLTFSTLLDLHWMDQFLTWNPAEYEGIKQIHMSCRKLWQPHLAIFSGANGYWATIIYSQCQVTHTGLVWSRPLMARAAVCSTRLRSWPYDRQNCTVRLGSWVHKGNQVNLRFGDSPVDIHNYTTGPGWALLEIGIDRTLGRRQSSPGDTYPELRYHFILERLAAGPAAVVVVPSVAVVLLTLCSLLLHFKDSRRLFLASFSLLGHFFFLTQISYVLPKNSADTPIILLFLRGSMVLNMLGIMMTLLLVGLRKRTVRPYVWVTKVNRLFSGYAKFVIFTEFEPSLLNGKSEEVAESSDEGSSAAANSEWCSFCNILNSATFVVTVFVYCIFFLCYLPRQDVTSGIWLQPDANG